MTWLTLITWLRGCLLNFSTIKLLFPPHLCSLGGCLCTAHTPGSWILLYFFVSRVSLNYLQFFCKGDLSHLLFIQSFILAWTHGYFISWVIIQYNILLLKLFLSVAPVSIRHTPINAGFVLFCFQQFFALWKFKKNISFPFVVKPFYFMDKYTYNV